MKRLFSIIPLYIPGMWIFAMASCIAGFLFGAESVAPITVSESPPAESKPASTATEDRSPGARDDLFLMKSMAFDLSEQGRYEEAVQYFDRYLKEDPTDTRTGLEFALLLSHVRRHKEAARVLEEIHRRAPDHEVVAFKLASEYVMLKRYGEAAKLFTSLAGSANDDIVLFARESLRTIREDAALDARTKAEKNVYALVRQQRDREVVETIQSLQQQQQLGTALAMERVFAMQRLGQDDAAREEMRRLLEAPRDSSIGETDLVMLRVDLLLQDGRTEEAVAMLKQIERENKGMTEGIRACRARLGLPPLADPDREAWGEMFADAMYTGRFGTVIGSGHVREGTFFPGARWLQPYAEFNFTADTRSEGGSSLGGLGSVYAENLTGLGLGIRALPLGNDSLVLYVSGGGKKDLLGDAKHAGDWFPDMQAGLSGYHGFGPGTLMRDLAGAEPDDWEKQLVATVLKPGDRSLEDDDEGDRLPPEPAPGVLWRHDWFVEGGGDFSYYRRLADWIGYGQAHEGLRLMQIGRVAAVDAYAIQNLTWDARGSYFDNYFEMGPGIRLLLRPEPLENIAQFEAGLRIEYLNGWYLGRNDLGRRGATQAGEYDDFRVGLSLSSRW